MAQTSPNEASSQEIQHALTEYRQTVLTSNQRSLTWLVSRINDTQPPASMDEGQANERKCQVVKDYLAMMELPEFINTAQQFIESMDQLIRPTGLDGILDDPTINARDDKIASYENVINRGLSEHADDELRDELQDRLVIPAEFRALLQQVDSVVGAGLPSYREMHQIAFFDGFNIPDEGEIAEAVLNLEGDNDLEVNVDGDWEVAAGWKTGSGQRGDCFALYCRSEDRDLDWAWRYHVDARDATHFQPVGNLATFLRMYATYEEQGQEGIEQMEGQPFA